MEKVLPKGWGEINLKKAVDFRKGKKPKVLSEEYFEGSVPYMDIQGLEKNIVSFYADSESAKYFKNNDVVIVWDGSRSGLILKPRSGAIGSTLGALSPYGYKSEYLYYFLLSQYEVINSKARGVGIPHVDPTYLWSLQLPLPPLPEQERIVAKLDKFFTQHEKIKKALDRIPQLLKAFRQNVLTQAVTGKLNKVSVLESKLISDFFEVKTGATPKKGVSKYYQEATIPWIKSGEVKNTFIYDVDECISEIAVKETNAKVFPKDTILVAMYGEGKTRGQVGWMKIEAATNQAIAALVNENLNEWTRGYIYLFCLSQYNEIRAKAEGGNQPNLNLSKIKNWEISIPQKVSEQQEIVCRVESLFAKADTVETRYQALKAKIDSLPQVILNKAFKGELVPQLPTDGDAKDLLAEIMALKKEVKGRGKK